MSVDHYENFPVASLLCPPRLRPAVSAIYHFARTADDLADEGDASPAARLADLAQYRGDLQAVLDGREPGARWRTVYGPLARSVERFDLPGALLHALLDAFVQDLGSPFYADRQSLLGYCRLSANPIGRLLLHLYRVADVRSVARADAVCSALQLINFWQDLSVDVPRGRIYVPTTDLQAHGLHLADLERGIDTQQTRRLVRSLCDWASTLMHQGAPLALELPGRAGWELRLVVQGGQRILEQIGRMGHATLSARPRLRVVDAPAMLWRSAWMRAVGR